MGRGFYFQLVCSRPHLFQVPLGSRSKAWLVCCARRGRRGEICNNYSLVLPRTPSENRCSSHRVCKLRFWCQEIWTCHDSWVALGGIMALADVESTYGGNRLEKGLNGDDVSTV
ncbi:hypothetical protein PoB_002638300 [Plakobranchus ocellatus]|uniref:Uncharacterized protein n=1 Tax=Plakobranchus ocellatus TaxID=259542 RepID=A0AAV3ZZR3_9GAST|nr:hypothetical protein PoB_002638300 [Plakobranchus ocellatus]